MVVAATKQTGARTYLWVPIACNRPVWTEGKWTGWDLNPRPLPCQDSDLPADLPARPPSMRDSRLKPCPQRRRGFTWIQTGIAGRWSNALDGDTSPRRAYQNGRLEGRWMRHGPLRGGSSEVPPHCARIPASFSSARSGYAGGVWDSPERYTVPEFGGF